MAEKKDFSYLTKLSMKELHRIAREKNLPTNVSYKELLANIVARSIGREDIVRGISKMTRIQKARENLRKALLAQRIIHNQATAAEVVDKEGNESSPSQVYMSEEQTKDEIIATIGDTEHPLFEILVPTSVSTESQCVTNNNAVQTSAYPMAVSTAPTPSPPVWATEADGDAGPSTRNEPASQASLDQYMAYLVEMRNKYGNIPGGYHIGAQHDKAHTLPVYVYDKPVMAPGIALSAQMSATESIIPDTSTNSDGASDLPASRSTTDMSNSTWSASEPSSPLFSNTNSQPEI